MHDFSFMDIYASLHQSNLVAELIESEDVDKLQWPRNVFRLDRKIIELPKKSNCTSSYWK